MLLLLDTCCFINLIKGNKNVYDYDFDLIKRDPNITIAITAYSFYELIRDIDSVEKLAKLRKELLTCGDFYILNMNNLLEYEGLEYGLDFLFSYHMQDGNHLLEFDKSRNELCEKIHSSLHKKIIFIIALISCTYLALDEAKIDKVSERTLYKIHYIDEEGFGIFNSKYNDLLRIFFEHKGMRYYDVNTKQLYNDYKSSKELAKLMQIMIIDILSIAEFEARCHFDGVAYTLKSILEELIHIHERTHSHFKDIGGFKGLYNFSLKEKELFINLFFDDAMKNFNMKIVKEGYRKIINHPFITGSIKKTIFNDIIDLTNLGCIENKALNNIAYITSDKEWKKHMEKFSSLKSMKATNEIIRRFAFKK